MGKVTGYFTIERNIIGLSLREMEPKLGFRPGRLTAGARVLVLARQPRVGEFVFAGSTRYSGAKGLVALGERRNVAIPHAWRGQRLVKVDPVLRHSAGEAYPAATLPIEQWELLVRLDAWEVCCLTAAQVYWPNLGRGKPDGPANLAR